MGFQTGLSGLNAASQSLEVTGNNIANASTVGFKQSRAQFADVFASSLSGGGASEIGIGTKVSAIDQQFTQGNIKTTSNPFDIAINGGGFFQLDQNGTTFFSRAGQFHIDNEGFIVTADSLKVMGFSADVNGIILPSAPAPILVSSAQIAPTITSEFRMNVNLESSEVPPANPVFTSTDPTSYNQSTSGSVFDSLGNSHVFSLYFVKTAVPGQWEVQADVDGTAPANVDLGAGAGNPVTLQFNTSGALTTAMPLGVDLTIGGGAASPLSFDLDFGGSSQFGAAFAVNSIFQDGFTSGRLSGSNISENGIVVGRYTNGQTRNLGQIVLATFADPTGLRPLGNNRWEASSQSGLAIVGAPGSGQLGLLQAAAVEESNVDLTAELVNLITAQRFFQSNAQTIKTQDAVLQTLVNLR